MHIHMFVFIVLQYNMIVKALTCDSDLVFKNKNTGTIQNILTHISFSLFILKFVES